MDSRSKQIARDLALKIKLEASLERTMRGLFKDIARYVRVHYKTSEQIPRTSIFDSEINSILRQHYRKVSKAFENRLREDLGKSLHIHETKKVDDKIAAATSKYGFARSVLQTTFISQTNEAEVHNAFERARYKAAKEGKQLSSDELADEASDDFEVRALGRAKTIGMTETQNVAEKTKDIEAEAIADEDIVAGGVTLRAENVTKTWSAILDSRTRDDHAEADDQTVDQDEAFIVGGYKLMFPGDDSLGAPLEQIINCRCNTSRAIELAELPSFVNHPENEAPTRGDVFFP